jgi:uncharacterized protein YukJ
LTVAAPYFDEYGGSPHYVITLAGVGRASFNLVVNAASTVEGMNNDSRVYSYFDLQFEDPICNKLKALSPGLHRNGFPRLDYWQDNSLLDLRRMRLMPYKDEEGNRFDINDQIDDILTIDESAPFKMLPYNNGRSVNDRKFWSPTAEKEIVVYGFGFLFQPAEDGLHETHMNQGNPRNGGHARENGVFQDGAVIVQRGDDFVAIFTAFQSQYVPTDADGFPARGAKPLPEFIGQG